MSSTTESLSVTSLIASGIDGKSATLADKTKVGLPGTEAGAIALVVITGFTVCAASLDFYFLRSKLRVVDTKEELTDLALHLASGGNLEAWPIGLLYGGTWFPLSLATLIMVT